jgi:glutathione S-transferase
MLSLFFSAGSCALATRIVLEEIGAPYELVRVDLSQKQQSSPDFLAINPKGRVPALVTDYGALTETPALLAYLAQAFPEAQLAPIGDPFAFAELQAFNSYLASTVHVAHAHGRRGTRWASEPASIEDMKRKVPDTMSACMALIEKDLFRGPWVMGEAYSVADAYLFTIEGWLAGDGVDINAFPRLADHYLRMGQRPAVQRALA